MSWLSALSAFLGLLQAVMDFARQERERGIGRGEAINEAVGLAKTQIERAINARKIMRDSLNALPDKLREHDENSRD